MKKASGILYFIDVIYEKTPLRYMLRPGDGEKLTHFRDHGVITIKASAFSASNDFALVTQQVMTGSGIPVHRHLCADEVFYVLAGTGNFIVDGRCYRFEQGATLFAPKGMWHGFENPEQELLLLWIAVPSGLEGFFRETCGTETAEPAQFTPDQIKQIAHKYGTEYR